MAVWSRRLRAQPCFPTRTCSVPTWACESRGEGSTSMKVACRVGAGAGFAGDRIDPAVRLAGSGEVDSIALECLAERTLLPALKARAQDASTGYDPRLRRRLRPLLPVARTHGVRVISNLGQANPRAAAQAIAELAAELGLTGVRVAAVVGDDVMALCDRIRWTRTPTAGRLLGAHAYLGSDAIAQALAQGADVVVTGRVADSALFAAPARPSLQSGQQALAGALTVGHLLECSGQLTGGNYEPVGGQMLPASGYADLGFPWAEVYEDGTAEIRLPPGAPGVLDPQTCTLQLLYEVHDPTRYATPDLVLDFSNVGFEVTGCGRVRVSGAVSRGRPPDLKVAGFLELPGWIADCEIGFAGTGALDRARRAAEVLRLRLADWRDEDVAIDIVGIDSILRAASLMVAAPPPEVRVHVSARCGDLEAAQTVEDEVYALTLSGPAGGCSVRSERRARIEVLDGYIDHEQVQPSLVWSQS
ncbi:MAG: acyclic terpene utilization AtuA family protein [Rubrivivax sp.]